MPVHARGRVAPEAVSSTVRGGSPAPWPFGKPSPFQPADIVNQVLNFGRPAPIDIRVSGPDSETAYAVALKLARDLNHVPGVDSHVYQVPDAATLTVNIDRSRARELGLGQQSMASNVLVSLNNSMQLTPNFWLNTRNNLSYPLVMQTPTHKITSTQEVWTLPLTGTQTEDAQVLMNVATFGRTKTPMVVSQLNIRPVHRWQELIGGLLCATAATLVFVPTMYRLLRQLARLEPPRSEPRGCA